MSQNQQRKLQPVVRMKKLGVPVRMPSPCRLVKVSETRRRPLVVWDEPCEDSFFVDGVNKLSDSDSFRETLEVFENPSPSRRFTIVHHCPEFTSVCPKTGQPDYGKIVFTYVPDQVCVELKSLKMYLQRFRNEGIFYEAVTNRIMDDFLAVVKPLRATVESQWTPRGGLHSNIVVEYPEKD